MNTFPLLDGIDICQNRHGGNAESVAANQTVDKTRGQQMVIGVLVKHNATAKEIAAELGVGINVISGRCSELKRAGAAKATGVRREGSMELELAK